MDRGNGAAGAAGEDYGAGVGDVARTAGPVDGKGDVLPCFELAAHGEQAFDGAARGAALGGAESEAFDDAASPLAVEIYGVQDHYAAIAPDPGRGEDAAMPECADAGLAGAANLDGVLHADDFEAQGGADQADGPVDEPGDDGNLKAAPGGKLGRRNFRGRIGDVSAGRRCRFPFGFHVAIV